MVGPRSSSEALYVSAHVFFRWKCRDDASTKAVAGALVILVHSAVLRTASSQFCCWLCNFFFFS